METLLKIIQQFAYWSRNRFFRGSSSTPSFKLYQSDKAGFRNYIAKSSNSVSSSSPQIAKWIIDRIEAIRSLKPCSMLKPRSTYLEWFIDILKYIMPPANVNAHSLDT